MINFGVAERKSQELELRMHNCNLLENDIEEPTGTCYIDGIIIIRPKVTRHYEPDRR